MSVTVEPLQHRRDLPSFLALPHQIYASDTDGVAPTQLVRGARLLGTGFRDPDSNFRVLVARRDGAVVARTVVFRDPAHDKHTDEQVAFFGYFEAVDDEAGEAVLDAASEQAKQWGADLLRGPRGFTRIDERGVLIEGHHTAPILAGHHPQRYRELLERLGFEKNHDALAYEIETDFPDGSPKPLPDKLQAKADGVDIEGLEVHGARWSQMLTDLDLAHTVMVEGFRDVPDNTPLPRSTFRALGLPFLAITDPEMLQLATVNGQPAGFALCVPELNEVLIHARGGFGPRAMVRMLRGKGTTLRTASFKLLSVVPEYRGTGLHALLIREAINGIRRAGYNRLEASLVDERNKPMRHIVEDAGMEIYRRYRVYERSV